MDLTFRYYRKKERKVKKSNVKFQQAAGKVVRLAFCTP